MAMYSYLNSPSVVPPSGVSTCNIDFNSLPSVEKYNCCVIGNVTTSSRYLPELDMVVNPIAVDYQSVCNQFCTEGKVGNNCNNNIGQQKYQNCISKSMPVNSCSGYSMPVAVLGKTYYYPNSATNQSCQNTVPC